MPTLSEQLADLSLRVGDMEARIMAFKSEKNEMRGNKVVSLKADANAAQERLTSELQATDHQISAPWAAFATAIKAKANAVRAMIGEEVDTTDPKRARKRAVRLEVNAEHSLRFALLAIEDAELAVAEAIDAGIHADAVDPHQGPKTEQR